MLYYFVYSPDNLTRGQIFDCQFAAERAQHRSSKLRIKTFETQAAARQFMKSKSAAAKRHKTLGLDHYIYARSYCEVEDEHHITYGVDIILSDGTSDHFSKVKDGTNVVLGEILAIKDVIERYPKASLYIHTTNQNIEDAYHSFRAGTLGVPTQSTVKLFTLFKYLAAYKCQVSTASPFDNI